MPDAEHLDSRSFQQRDWFPSDRNTAAICDAAEISAPVLKRAAAGGTMAKFLWICALLLAGTSVLHAEERPWGTEPLTLSTEHIYRQASEIAASETDDVEYLYEETVIRIEADGRRTETIHSIYRVLTESGVEQFGSVEAEWSPWFQNRPTISARVVNGSTDEVRLIDREIVEGPAAHGDSVYSDCRKLQAPLPAVRTGSVVETFVSTTEHQCFFSAGISECRLFNRFYPSKHIRLRVDVVDTLPFRHQADGPGLTSSETHENGRRICIWETVESPGFEDFEVPVPSNLLQGTQVAFSTCDSWGSVISGYSSLIEPKLSAANLSADVEKVLAGETNTRNKINKLLSHIRQQIRYTGLMFGDGSIVPTAPEETLRRRYGDCKDQSALLIAMLRQAGIEASPVLIRSSIGRDVIPESPGLGHFNHMIVHVDAEEDLWIDPVATTVPLGQLPVPDQNRLCLIIRTGEQALRKSPGSTPEDNGLHRVREIAVVEEGGSTLKETTVYRGSSASDIRQMVIAGSEKEFRNSLRQRTMERLLTQNVDSIHWNNVRDINLPLELTVTCVGTELARCRMNSAEVVLLPATVLQGFPEELLDLRPAMTAEELAQYRRNPFSSASQKLSEEKQRPRKHPLPLDTPQTMQLVNRIKWPDGFVPVDIPASQSFAIGSGFLTTRFFLDTDGVLVGEFTASTGSGTLTPDEVRQWQECVRTLSGGDDVTQWQVTVQATHSANQHLDRGRMKLGLKQLRDQVTQHPENPAYRIRLAEAYAETGFNAMARSMALDTIRLFPESSAAYASASLIFDMPPVEGEITTAEDRQKAIEFSREAARHAPEDADLKIQLAELLKASPQGILSSREQLRECVTLYRSAEDTLLPAGHELILQCLFFAGDYAEVCRHHDKYIPDESLLFYKVAAVAILHGADRAAGLMENTSTNEIRLQTAALTDLHLQLAREYERAQELLTLVAEWPDAPRRSVQDGLAQLNSVQRYETVLKPESDPTGVVQRLIINALVDQPLCGSHESLLHHSDERFRDIARQIIFQWDSGRRTDGIRPAERLADVISQGTFDVTGESTSGYKVAASIGFMTDVTFLLTTVDGTLKVLTTTGTPHVLGDDALEFLKKGHLLQARQCVTWASEETDAAAESNPLEGSPLTRVWTKQDSLYANASRIRYGAMMVASPEKCPDALSVLLDMRRRVRQPEQLQIDRRIVTWTGSQKRWKDGLTAIDRLLRVPGGREKYWTKKVKFLSSDKQYTQALAWIEQQLRQNTADTHALCLKAQVFQQQGNHQESLRLLRAACSSREAESGTFNQAAWTAVLAGSIDQQAVVDAERAVEMSGESDTAALHTLATVCAESGRTAEAMRSLHRYILLSDDSADDHDDDYVLGRLAEQMNMPDVADFYYDRIQNAATSPEPGSSAFLVLQRRTKMKTVSHQTAPKQ
jgi:tetratricopeptide (TPR) repeat protein